jgi:putative flippase GtrA
MLVLAHWAYLTTALLLGPLVVARFLVCGPGTKAPEARGDNGPPSTWASTFLRKIRKVLTSELGGQLLLLSVGFALGYLFYRFGARHLAGRTDLGSLPIAQWPSTWRQLWKTHWAELAPHHWPYFLLGVAFAGLAQLSVPALRRQAGIAWRAAMAVAIAATVYFLFIGTRRWVFLNACSGRYVYPALFVFQEGFALFAVGLLTPAIRDRLSRHAYAPAAVGLLLAALINFHSPSIMKVHEDLSHTFGLGGRTSDVLAAHCTHVAGDYWKVWPTVYHANLMLREQGESRIVWGITLHAEPTRAQWRNMPLGDLRIAVALDDREAAQTWLQALHLPPMVEVERHSTIYVLRPAEVVLREQQQKSAGRLDADGMFPTVVWEPQGK